MNPGSDFLHTIVTVVQANESRGAWDLLGTALGLPESLARTRAGLQPSELALGAYSLLTIAPSLIADRVEALSVYSPDELVQLSHRLELIQPDDGNPFIESAVRSITAHIRQDRIDPHAPSWEWEMHLRSTPSQARILATRPLINRTLSYTQLDAAIACGGSVLRSLRMQACCIQADVFEHYLGRLSTFDPWVGSCIIELSRATSFDQQLWYSECERLVASCGDARQLIPLMYTLINKAWLVA